MLRVRVGGRYTQTPVGRAAYEAGAPVPPALLQELGVRAAAPVTIAGLPAAAAAADMTVVQVENFAVCARKLAATSNRSRVAGGFLAFVGGEWAAVAIVRPRTVVFAGGSRRLQHHLKRVAAAPAAFMFSRRKTPRPAKRARITAAGLPVQEFPGFTLVGGELALVYGQKDL